MARSFNSVATFVEFSVVRVSIGLAWPVLMNPSSSEISSAADVHNHQIEETE